MKNYNEKLTLDERILKILEKNKFSLEHLGTHFYKAVIKEIVISLSSAKNYEEFRKIEEQLKCYASSEYSLFYFDIAKRQFNVELDTFHRLIREASLNTKIMRNSSNNEKNYMILSLGFAKFILSTIDEVEKDKSNEEFEDDITHNLDTKPKKRTLK